LQALALFVAPLVLVPVADADPDPDADAAADVDGGDVFEELEEPHALRASTTASIATQATRIMRPREIKAHNLHAAEFGATSAGNTHTARWPRLSI
jgi:hypothetical protein